MASLNRGSSSTPGALGVDEADDPLPPPPRSCPNGRDDAPRQVESSYAAPCAPAFVGDKGGATYQGVTADEIRVAINGTNAGGSDPCADRELPPEPPATGECDADRTFRVLMQHCNEYFQLYGRSLGMRFHEKPSWAIAGGHAPGRNNYVNDAALVWWCPSCQDAQYLSTVGAYMDEDLATGCRPGQVPSEDRVFVEENAVTTPVDAAEYEAP